MIRMDKFKGLAPVFHPRELPPTAAQRALEVELEDGTLKPLNAPGATVGALTLAGDRSMYRYNGTWLSWPGDVSVEESPISEDLYQRIYYTGDGAPKLRATISAEPHVRALGIPAPDTAVSGTLAAKGSVSWTRKWHAFFEDADGTRSSEQDIADGDVTEDTPGAKYVISPKPTGSGGTLVVWFEAFSAAGSYLGSVYPNISVYRTNNDLLLNGAAVDSNQTTGGSNVTINLQYNTSRLTGFNAERVYVFTWVSDMDEEGPPSPPLTLDVSPAQDVDLVIPTTAPYAWITKKRIYRTVTVDNDTQYELVAELPVATSNYTDSLYDIDIPGDALISVDFDPPPSDMVGLVAMPGGFFAGFSGNTVYFSEPNFPHAWPEKYAQALPAEVKALGVSGNTLVVATANIPYTLAGFSPEGMNPTKLATPLAGTNLRGVAELDGTVYYVTNNGIAVVVGQTPELWTKSIIGTDYWQALNPATIRLEAHDSRLYAFHDTGFLLFDLSAGEFDLTESAQVVQAYHVDREAEEFFVVLNGKTDIQEYGTGAALTLQYRSKEFVSPKPGKQAVYRVIAASYPVTLNVYADGVLSSTVTVADDKVHRLPSTPPNKVWSLEVLADDRVFSIETGGSVEELAG